MRNSQRHFSFFGGCPSFPTEKSSHDGGISIDGASISSWRFLELVGFMSHVENLKSVLFCLTDVFTYLYIYIHIFVYKYIYIYYIYTL